MLTLSIVGAAGYAGGELLRLVLGHPELQLGQAISTSHAGSPVHACHPNLRGHVRATFEAPDALHACDVLVLAGGHGTHAERIDEYAQLAPRILDLSADFRLRSAEAYEQTYGRPHPKPEWLERFVYGLPELHREQLRGATHVSGVGCNATAMTLALLPLARPRAARCRASRATTPSARARCAPTPRPTTGIWPRCVRRCRTPATCRSR